MLQNTSPSSPSNYQVLDFPGQKLGADNFLKAEVDAYIRLSKYLPLIANSGLLFGKIKTLQLRYGTTTGGDGGITNVYDVKYVGDVSLTEALCSRYGWGPVLEMTQKMVDGGGIEYRDTHDCLPRDPNMPVEQSYWSDSDGPVVFWTDNRIMLANELLVGDESVGTESASLFQPFWGYTRSTEGLSCCMYL